MSFYPLRRRLLTLLLGCAACQDAAPPPITAFVVTPAEVAPGEAASFSWRTTGATTCTLAFGEDAPIPLSGCAEGSYRHTYAEAGRYLATFAATAAEGRREARVSVTVTAEAATPRFSARADGLSVSFDASASVAPPGSRFSWDFGDGGEGKGVNVTHRYARAGDYPVTLTLLTDGTPTRTTETVSAVAEGTAAERTVLFDGGDLTAWRAERGGAMWRLADDYMEVTPGGSVGANDLRTKEVFTDFRLYLEFWVPGTPAGTAEQARGNSGVYLQGRYEVQVLDSHGRTLSGQNDAGAVYEVSDAARNVSRPAGTWQSYEIVFRAARFRGGAKVSPARVSVLWNGTLVQDDVAVDGPTRLGDAEAGSSGPLAGPIVLQDHGDRVRYREVWLEPL